MQGPARVPETVPYGHEDHEAPTFWHSYQGACQVGDVQLGLGMAIESGFFSKTVLLCRRPL